MPNDDLSTTTFKGLRAIFGDASAASPDYPLRPKENVQDDPFDEHVVNELSDYFASNGVDAAIRKSPGPLISPDFVVYRPSLVSGGNYVGAASDPTALMAVEVKKLERTTAGSVARASGLDYNTTPPCGTVRLYGSDGGALDVRASYLFVCQEQLGDRKYRLSALALCDGDVLNEDFDFYLSIVGQRTKEIGLGTFGDGVNRLRPMLIFGNPLGADLFDRRSTLISRFPDQATPSSGLERVGKLTRTKPGDGGGASVFYCYRDAGDSDGAAPFDSTDPFHVPKRTEATQGRGRFRLPWSPTQN